MKTPTSVLNLVLLLLIAATQVGCSGIETKNMMPDTSTLRARQIDRALSVLEVTGAQKERFGGPAMISNEGFKEALVAALQQGGLFRSVSPAPGGELEMYAEFVAQGQGDKGLDYKSAMVVEYWIIERDGRREVWREAFNSRHEVTVGQALAGSTRTVKAQEGSVRKNLAQMLETLAEWNYPKQ
jgi:hypothetical protein